MTPDEESAIRAILTSQNITYKVRSSDVHAENLNKTRGNDKFCLATECFWSHDNINLYLDDLQMFFEQHVHVMEVGQSYEGRSLKTITITNGDGDQQKKVIFVDAGIHAREWIAPSTALYIIRELVENFEANEHLLKDYDWVVMPMVNPDGYEFSRSDPSNRFWRKTRKPYRDCYGVDPNRNFDFMFGYSGASDDPCDYVYKGPYPFSEPETAVLRDVFLSLNGRMVFYLTLHSFGSSFLYPWGYEALDTDNVQDLFAVGQAGSNAIFQYSGRKYTVGSAAKISYPASGGSDDYVYAGNHAKISITMELPGGGELGFDPPESSIKPYVEESWIGIVAMAKKVFELNQV